MKNASENLVILANSCGIKMGKVLDCDRKCSTSLPQCPECLHFTEEKVFYTSNVVENEDSQVF